MYCDEFGFSERPFDVTPDPAFLYLGDRHQEVLAALQYGITEKRGFILLTGEVGTGKTTLLNTLRGKLEQECQVAYIFNTNIGFEELLNTALFEWTVTDKEEKLDIGPAIDAINAYAIEQLGLGNKVILIIDEAQNLSIETLEQIRLLSNLETNKQKLIQILLAGQPELDTKLGLNQLRQLQQRINIKRCLWPLTRKETFAYIEHRLKVASKASSFQITQGAKQAIWRYSMGIPRKINTLADNALLLCYGLYKDKLNKQIVREAVKDLQQDTSRIQWSLFSKLNPPLAKTSSLSIAAVIVGAVVVGGLWAIDYKPEMFPTAIEVETLQQQDSPKNNAKLPPVISPDIGIVSEKKPKILNQKVDSKTGTEIPTGLPLATNTRPLAMFSKSDSKKISEIPSSFPLVSKSDPETSPETSQPDDDFKNSTKIPPVIPFASQQKTEPEQVVASKQTMTFEQNLVSEKNLIAVRMGQYGPELNQKKEITPEPTIKSVDSAIPSTAPSIVQTTTQIQASIAPKMSSESKDYIEVAVMQGDILSQLVKDNLGTFKRFPLWKFLEYNPKIKDPDNLKVGQVIKIPITKNLKNRLEE